MTELIRRAKAGEEVVLTKHGRAVVRLVPVEAAVAPEAFSPTLRLAATVARLIDGLGIEIVSVTPASARRIAAAYAGWGRGGRPAGLNFGDCFSYEVARERS